MNALVLQCGGPTAVVNVTLAALVRRWQSASAGELRAGRFGLSALLASDWTPVPLDAAWLSGIEETSGMALGGGRVRLQDSDLAAASARLTSDGIETLFLIGGNGTMAAGRSLAADARGGLRVIAIPKTIDNDIPRTDVCPGFPSAARFLIECVRDVAADAGSMRGYEDVVLIEAMGRHAGWLAASTQLARSSSCNAPHVVLTPEAPLDEDAWLTSVREHHARHGVCVVTVAEGVRGLDGMFVAERHPDHDVERDASGQVILGRSGGPLPYLASLVRGRLGLRCRLVRPDVLQRCSRAHVTRGDREIAALAGAAAVEHCLASPDTAAAMIALRHDGSAWRTEPVPLDQVRGERVLPTGYDWTESPLRSLI